MAEDFVIEMLHITKEFPGIKANDDITLQLRKGEVHALLGENGAGKSTLMSVLFGLYQPEEGKILKNGKEVAIRNPNDANALGIGMVHQHFKLVECFSVLDNIILGVEPNKLGFLQKAEARKKVVALSEKYGLRVDPDALISDISVGMQQRVEILKMLYRDNEILIFDEPTAVLTPQEIDELMEIMRGFKKEGKSILFITHKLNEIMAVADRCTVLRKGKYMGTVDIKDTTKEELSRMMVGRDVQLQVDKKPAHPGDVVLDVEGVTIHNDQRKKDSVKDVTFQVHGRRDRLSGGHRGQRPDRARLWSHRPRKTVGRQDHAGRQGHHPREHPPALEGRHEPHPRRPPQARSGAGLQPREQHGAPALLAARVPEGRLHPVR